MSVLCWAAAAISAACVVLWLAAIFWVWFGVSTAQQNCTCLWISRGRIALGDVNVSYYVFSDLTPAGGGASLGGTWSMYWTYPDFSRPLRALEQFEWIPRVYLPDGNYPSRWGVALPLWLPALALAALAWQFRGKQTHVGNSCQKCGYLLEGIPLESPCPECGGRRPQRRCLAGVTVN